MNEDPMNATSRSTVSRTARSAAAILCGAWLCACASLNRKEKGAVIGAAAGGVAGAVIGNQTGSTTRGAIIGAGVGGAAGAIIGHQMDQQAKELKQNIPGATVARVGEGIAVTFASGLLYDFDSDVVRSDAAQNLRALAASLAKYPNTDLLIVGHTDAVGTSDYNQTLSQRRATAAANFLAAEGVSAARLRAVGRGETEPLATNDTEAGRQLNRRVEIAIVASASARKTATGDRSAVLPRLAASDR
jgi:outer membrane protein OmpA-like peptidoglycan-associated protein